MHLLLTSKEEGSQKHKKQIAKIRDGTVDFFPPAAIISLDEKTLKFLYLLADVILLLSFIDLYLKSISTIRRVIYD